MLHDGSADFENSRDMEQRIPELVRLLNSAGTDVKEDGSRQAMLDTVLSTQMSLLLGDRDSVVFTLATIRTYLGFLALEGRIEGFTFEPVYCEDPHCAVHGDDA